MPHSDEPSAKNRVGLASVDLDTPPLLWTTRMAAEALRRARSPDGERLIAFHRMPASEQNALLDEAETMIRAAFGTMAHWDDAKIARFARAHQPED